MGLKDKFKLNDKTLKQDKKEEKPLIVSIDSNKENESKKSSLGMILFALIMGFIVGVVVWSIFRLSLVLTDLIWETTFTLANFYWMPLIICVVGGICIGLFTKYYGNNLHTINEIVEIVETKGEFKYDNLFRAAIAFLLPIIFGGSIGPEAGLTGIVVDLCTRLNNALKKAGIRIINLPEITVSAAVSSIFGTPVIGMVSGVSGVFYRDRNEELYNEYNPKDYTFRKEVKFILYTASALGSFGAFILLNSIFPGGMGLPRFTAITLQLSDVLWIIPCLIIGYIGGLLFHFGEYAFSNLSDKLKDYTVLKPVIAGIILGILGSILPLVLFSGESNSFILMDNWQGMAVIILIAIGLIKCILTPLCLNFGWKGGHFFPCIFAGIALGYGIALFSGIDPMFCVSITTAATLASIQRRPLLVLALLFLCFPISSIIWLGIACLIASALPIPKKWISENYS